jgi:hypothetical protein
MFEGLYMDEKTSHPRLVRLAREVGAEIPLPPAEKEAKNEAAPASPSSLLDAIRRLLHAGTWRA